MASIILGAAGSAIAGPVGGMLGGALGSFIDQKIAGHFAKKPALIDLVVEASTFGQVIPVVKGRNKVAGNMIASTILQPTPHSGKGKGGSGKGGGGSTTSYYTYTATFAVAICRGPINNVWRVFADSKDIWDMEGPTVSATSDSPLIASGFTSSQWGGVATIFEYGQSNKNNHTQSAVGNIFFYYGTEDQEPDPIMQATFGMNYTPAYRGLAYAVFLALPLQYFGNRIPNISFEVNGFYSGGVTNANSVVNATTVYSNPNLFTGSETPNELNTGHAYVYNLGANLIYDCSEHGVDTFLGGNGDVYSTLDFATDPIATSLGGTPTFSSVTSGREVGPDGNLHIAVQVSGGVGEALLTFSPYAGVTSIVTVATNPGTGLGAMGDNGIVCWMGSHNYLFLSDNSGLFQIYNSAMQLVYAGNLATGDQELWYYATPGSSTPVELQHTTSGGSGFAFPTNVTWAEALGLLVVLDGANNTLFTINLSGPPYISAPISTGPLGGSGYRVIFDNTTNNFIFMNSTNVWAVSNINTISITGGETANGLNSTASGWYSYTDWFSNQAPFGNVFVVSGSQVFNLETTDLGAINISGNLTSPFDWSNPPNLNGGPVSTPAAIDVPAPGSPMLFSPFQDGAIEYMSTDADGVALDKGWAVYNFQPPATQLGTVVEQICEECGLTSGQIDVTAATDLCWGYTISSEATGRQAIEPLQEIFLFDLVESNNKLVFRYRQANAASPSLTISENDLAARELQPGQHPGANPPPKLIETRTQTLDLPHVLLLRYKTTSGDRYTVDFSFEIAGQYARRTFAAVQKLSHISINTPVVLDDNTAGAIVAKILALQYINRTRLQFTLPLKYIALEAGDVVNLSFHDGEGNPVGYNIYVQQADIGADNTIKVQGVVSDVAVYGVTAIGQVSQNHPAGSGSGVIISGQPTTLELMDLPPLQDSDDNVGLYWGMCGVGTSAGWSGALLRSVDGGSSYATIGAQNIPSVIGIAETVLPAAPATHWDTTNTVTVRLISGAISSVTPLQVLNSNTNAFLLGGELCAAASAVQNSNGSYTLSTLRRGLRGTEVAVGTHVVGERFVMLSNLGPTLDFVETLGDIGAQELYIGATVGASPATQVPVSFVESGRRIMPNPVANACIAYDGSGNATISWNPRNRVNFEWLDGQEQSVQGNGIEDNYEVDIIKSGNVVRTITMGTVVTGTVGSQSGQDTGRRTASYLVADQITDGVTAPITCSIYQISSIIGRGVARTITQ